MVYQAKFFTVVFLTFFLQTTVSANTDIEDGHLSLVDVSVTVNVQFDPMCSQNSNITINLMVPRSSNLLNVLEYANYDHHNVFTGYEVLYLHNMGYFLIVLNGLSDNTTCGWDFNTIPISFPSTAAFLNVVTPLSLDNVFVSNFGFIVNFVYSTDLINKPTLDSALKISSNGSEFPSNIIIPSMEVQYRVNYPEVMSCPSGAPAPAPLTVTIQEGHSALNVMENAALISSNLSFQASNFWGLFYSIQSIGVVAMTQSCQWCALFSPDSTVLPFFLPLDVNNYIIPVGGGVLILEYRAHGSCNSIQNAINARNLTDELLEVVGLATGSGASTVMLCPPLIIMTIITSFLIKC